VVEQGAKLILMGIKEFVPATVITPTTWQDQLTQSEFAQNWQLSLHWTDLVAHLLGAMVAGTAMAIFDDSYQQDHWACAWIIEGSTSTNWITGSMITPGTTDKHSSFRSKATGVYGLLLALWHCLKQNTELQGTLLVACDGKLVLDCLC